MILYIIKGLPPQTIIGSIKQKIRKKGSRLTRGILITESNIYIKYHINGPYIERDGRVA